MANIVVTGAAGFIGSHTVDRLLKAGHRVWGVDNLRTGRRENLADAITAGLQFRKFDVLDSRRWDRLLVGTRIDAIIHLAALVSVSESIEKPDENFRLNVEATHRVAAAALKHGVKRLVFASSAAVYGDTKKVPVVESLLPKPISPYGAAKLASEQLLLGHAAVHGLVVRVQRYFNVFGPRQDPSSPYSGVISIFLRRFAQGEPVTIHGDGRQTRDFVFVADIAQANMLAATKPGLESGVANICTGRQVSLRELVEGIARFYPNADQPLYGPSRRGDIRHSAGNPRAAKMALGFSAHASLAQGLRQMVEAAAVSGQPAPASGHGRNHKR